MLINPTPPCYNCFKKQNVLISLHRECYVTVDEIVVAKKFKDALNRTFNDQGGIFWRGMSDDQLSSYVMRKIEEFVRANGKTLIASLMTGRQPNKKYLDDEGNFSDEPHAEGLTEDDKVEDYDNAMYILNEKTQALYIT